MMVDVTAYLIAGLVAGTAGWRASGALITLRALFHVYRYFLFIALSAH